MYLYPESGVLNSHLAEDQPLGWVCLEHSGLVLQPSLLNPLEKGHPSIW